MIKKIKRFIIFSGILFIFLFIIASRKIVYIQAGTNIQNSEIIVREIVYGTSEMGRDLTCTIIEPEEITHTVLLNFAIHGFEDYYDHDAQVLVDTAQQIIAHFELADTLNGCRLMVVSCANPDGLIDGTTKDGFGRCNSNGIDLNRDFDVSHYPYTNSRNYTPYPFSASESRALRDLILEYDPDIVLDCHGWENCTIGDSELAKIFYEEMGLIHNSNFSDNAHGYFSYWAHEQGATSLLVEFSGPGFDKTLFINAVDRIVLNNDETYSGEFESDIILSCYTPVQAYTISENNVTVFKDIAGEQGGTIYGKTDLCTIDKIYQNGWVRVRYPISSGYKIAYSTLDVFFDCDHQISLLTVSFKQNQTVYRRKDLTEKLGTVYSSDISYCFAVDNDVIQILYPLDNGGWKLGWVNRSAAEFESTDVLFLPDSLEAIQEAAFQGCGMQEVYIPDSVRNIDNYAFADCYNLKRIHIPVTTQSIGVFSFNNTSVNLVICGKKGSYAETYALECGYLFEEE